MGTDATLALAVRATRSLGKVSQIGLAGGTARLKVLENSKVPFEATLWGTVKELRKVIALAEKRRTHANTHRTRVAKRRFSMMRV